MSITTSNTCTKLTGLMIVSWDANCAANEETNGVDLRSSASLRGQVKRAKAEIVDKDPGSAVGLPGPFIPNLPPASGNSGVIKSFILPGNKTGVVSFFSPAGNLAT